MRLLWFDPSPALQEELILPSEQANWLRNVLRMDEGATFQARSRQFFYTVKIKTLTKQKVVVVIETRQEIVSQKPILELWQAIPKAGRFEIALRMAVEAGVSRIVPLLTDFTDVKLKEENTKHARYHRIAIEAVSQSGSLHFQEVCPPQNLKMALQSLQEETTLLFCHQELLKSHKLIDLLADHKGRIIVVIGPEGGFSKAEVELLLCHNAIPLYFGDTILRSETAGIFAIGAIKSNLTFNPSGS